ncbi:MAG: outer membrane protein assembly factor BamA [Bacteroidota bacterium]|nr:outer membrane protein assembly factor BamA [Bacteroidota bacterium]MDP4233155.1 outer membrane protein assembly factor BamA [Bacteroidota bacterium]MDP4241700.1 outer membrane protein assembly factor BamA [Bacteroidota bacterium]MDP4287358.1 outer membrane protein assembly factor BamA [Bacteroidota bacterium]
MLIKLMRLAFALLFLLLSTGISLAQAPGAPEQQYTILGLSIVGNRTGDAQTIIGQSGLYKGERVTLTGDVIHSATQQLWSMGIFSDVEIVIDRELPQSDSTIGLFLSIHVRELPHLGTYTIIGNKEIKTPELEKAMGLKDGDFLRPWEVESARNRVKALYEKQGYHFATVTMTQVPAKDSGTVDLSIVINEGKEMVVRHIDFVGNEHVSSSDLRSAMEDTKEKKWWRIFSSSTFDEKKYEDDKRKLIDYYHSKGYRDAAIVSDSVWASGATTSDNDLSILITVSEGHEYHVRNIAVIGADVFTPDEIREHLGFHKGDIYDLVRLEMNLHGPTPDYSDVGSLYYDRGYIANIAKEETVLPGDSIDLVLRVVEGKQHFFRYVDIKGNTKTKDYVVRRELFTRPGDAFSRAAIIRSLRQLSQLNYFNQEKLTPDVNFQPEAPEVDVTYNVEERSSDTFNASIGYGGTLGLTGSVGVSFNNFDITDPLHGGGGEVLSISAEIGASSYRTLSLNFTEPWLNQRPTSLGFQVYTTHSEYIYVADRSGASLSLGRRFRWPDDYFRADWTLSASHSNISNGGGIYIPGIHDETSIQQVISRISSDNPVFPTSGSEFSFLTRIAYLPLTSIAPNQPANYFRNNFTMKFYTPMLAIGGQNKLVLMTSADIGQLGGVGSTPFVPPTELFVMGGSGLATGIYSIPLRGYDDASIGVQKGVATTSIYAPGGEAYSRYVAELRFIISLEPIPIYFLSFAEAGNVWADFSHADLFDLKRAIGVGGRVQVPAVGMIGLDFGYGFDPRTAFGAPAGWHTHFQFGRGF